MAHIKQVHKRPEKNLAPDVVDSVQRNWTIEDDAEQPRMNFKRAMIWVPLDQDQVSLDIRAHELAHIRWTPEDGYSRASMADLPHDLINAVEDGRINSHLQDCGVRAPNFEEHPVYHEERIIWAMAKNPLIAAEMRYCAEGTDWKPKAQAIVEQLWPDDAEWINAQAERLSVPGAGYDVTEAVARETYEVYCVPPPPPLPPSEGGEEEGDGDPNPGGESRPGPSGSGASQNEESPEPETTEDQPDGSQDQSDQSDESDEGDDQEGQSGQGKGDDESEDDAAEKGSDEDDAESEEAESDATSGSESTPGEDDQPDQSGGQSGDKSDEGESQSGETDQSGGQSGGESSDEPDEDESQDESSQSGSGQSTQSGQDEPGDKSGSSGPPSDEESSDGGAGGTGGSASSSNERSIPDGSDDESESPPKEKLPPPPRPQPREPIKPEEAEVENAPWNAKQELPKRPEDDAPTVSNEGGQESLQINGIDEDEAVEAGVKGLWAHRDIVQPRLKNRKGQWCDMRIKEPELTQALPRARRAAKRGEFYGRAPRYPHRMATDRRVFARKQGGKEYPGTLLVDVSGTMALTGTEIGHVLDSYPAAEVRDYSSCFVNNYGDLRTVAKDGMRLTNEQLDAGRCCNSCRSNGVDGPALRWLAQQPRPRFWISDGKVNGVNEMMTVNLLEECARLCAQNRIIRVSSVEEFIRRYC